MWSISQRVGTVFLRTGHRELLREAARVLSPGGKYMMFSVFRNDGLGHKDMAEMLAHSAFGGGLEVKKPLPVGIDV